MTVRRRDAAVDAAILAALVAAGAALRWPYLMAGIWRDEGSTYFETVRQSFFGVFGAVARGELNPPGYFLFERAWTALAGGGEVALKLPSVVFGLALIVATYALGRAAWSRGVALGAAAFACVSPTALDLSGEARPYTLAALLAAVAVTLYLRAAGRRGAAIAWFALAGAALAYVHYTGIVLLLLLAVATPYVLWREHALDLLGRFALAFAAIAVLYAPWLPVMRVHLATGAPWTNEIAPAGMPAAAQDDLGFLFPLVSAHSTLVLVLAAGLIAATAVAVVRRSRGDAAAWPSGPSTVLAVCTLGGAVCAALLSQREPRYMFVFAPGAWVWFCVLLGSLGTWIRALKPAVAWSTGGVLALGIGLLAGGELRARAKAPPVIASSGVRAAAVKAAALPGGGKTVFLAVPDYVGPTLAYYVGVPLDAAVNGFAQWDHPERFTPQGYASLWDSPTAVDDAIGRIETAARGGATTLMVVRDYDIEDRGKMHYTRAVKLLAALRAKYPVIDEAHEAGRKESINVDVFALRPKG